MDLLVALGARCGFAEDQNNMSSGVSQVSETSSLFNQWKYLLVSTIMEIECSSPS
jgi:hypothetical protein